MREQGRLDNAYRVAGVVALVLGYVLLQKLRAAHFEVSFGSAVQPWWVSVLVLLLAVALVPLGIWATVRNSVLARPLRVLGSYLSMTALAAFLMAPIVWMVLVSLHPSKSPIPSLGDIVPHEPAWKNYHFVLFHPTLPVSTFFLNSVFVTVVVVLGQLFVSSLAAYGFARLHFKGKNLAFGLFIGSLMFAGVVTQIPVYLLVRSAGWLDTYWALIVPGLSSAFSVFLLRQSFMTIPEELDEAARIDGAGDFRIYLRVILPLSRAALATAAAFSFFGVWTDFFWPLLSTSSTEMRTLEVGLSVFKNSYGQSNWPLQMTAAVIVMIPSVLAFLFTQRYFTKGITLGSIK